MRRAWVILLGILLAVLLALAGCDLFNQSPIARIAASVLSGASPLTVTFDASESTDPDGVIIHYLWDFGDGDTANGETVPHTYITRQRVAAAKRLLEETPGMKLHEVAATVGFSRPKQLTLAFQKFEGKSPRQYRQSLDA